MSYEPDKLTESSVMSDEDRKQWRFLSGVDESEDYETDITEIWVATESGKNAGLFALVEASGCSCWVGEYDLSEYDTLDALEKELIGVDGKYARPATDTCKVMVDEARKAMLYEHLVNAAVARH